MDQAELEDFQKSLHTEKDLTEADKFTQAFEKVMEELDVLYRGVYDNDEALRTAALCLIAQRHLINAIGASEFKARSLKRDIDFKKAEVYSDLKLATPQGGKKLTESALQQLVNKDSDVHQLYLDQAEAEREYKEYSNMLMLLKDAHITFRSVSKKGD